MMEFVIDRIENIVGKEENTGHQYFLFPLNLFSMPLAQGCLNLS